MPAPSDVAAFRRAVRRLRAIAPLDQRVVVRRVHMQSYFGTTVAGEGGPILIAINVDYDWCVQIDTLIHEWTHARLYDENYTTWHEHGDLFFLELGAIWRAYHRQA